MTKDATIAGDGASSSCASPVTSVRGSTPVLTRTGCGARSSSTSKHQVARSRQGRGVSLGRLRPVGSSEVPGRSAYALALACLGVFSPFCGTRTVGRRGTIGECQDEKGYEGRKYAPPFSLVGSEGGVMGEEDRSADGSTLRGPRAVEGESGRSTGARRPLASLLAEAGVASEEQLRLAVAEGMGSGERLGEIVLR